MAVEAVIGNERVMEEGVHREHYRLHPQQLLPPPALRHFDASLFVKGLEPPPFVLDVAVVVVSDYSDYSPTAMELERNVLVTE